MSPLFSPLWSNSLGTLFIVVASGDVEGVKIGWAILVSKVGTSVPCGRSGLVAGWSLAWSLNL